MEYYITFPGRLPGLNEYIRACRTNIHIASSFKKDCLEQLALIIFNEMQRTTVKCPVHLTYNFYEPNRKRDLDNVSGFAHKVIQDALISCRIIPNDGWKNVSGYTDNFYVDNKHPRVELVIREVDV